MPLSSDEHLSLVNKLNEVIQSQGAVSDLNDKVDSMREAIMSKLVELKQWQIESTLRQEMIETRTNNHSAKNYEFQVKTDKENARMKDLINANTLRTASDLNTQINLIRDDISSVKVNNSRVNAGVSGGVTLLVNAILYGMTKVMPG